jgi:hypothetical protein
MSPPYPTSFASKADPEVELDSTPGPGAYEITGKLLEPKHAFQKRSSSVPRLRIAEIEAQKSRLGPGTYFTGRDSTNGPSYSFSARHQKGSILHRQGGPGPGTYDIKSNAEEASRTKKGFSLTFRHKEPNSGEHMPGPGQYTHDLLQNSLKYRYKNSHLHADDLASEKP